MVCDPDTDRQGTGADRMHRTRSGGEGYRACFVIEQECIWRMGGERTIYRKPLFPSYVIADTDTPEAFFLALKRIPKLSKLLRTDCEFWSIRKRKRNALPDDGRTAADVDEDKIKDICRKKQKSAKRQHLPE